MNKKYKYFKVSDIFHSKRGKRWIKENQTPGDIAYVSSTALNNGIDNFVTPPDFMKIYKNKLTFSNSGSVGRLFYHDYDFVASDHVTVIWIKDRELNKYIALFLKPIFEHIRYKYNFGREIKDPRLKAETIYLPINDSDKPDWDYMEKYIISLEEKVKFKKIHTNNKIQNIKPNVNEWKYFKLAELFNIEGVGSISVEQLEKKYGFGNFPYITRTEKNNGLTGFYDYKSAPANVLTIETSLSGLCFFHEYEFSTGDHIAVLKPKNFEFNKYRALFIKSVWCKNSYKYDYGRPAIIKNIKNTLVPLPALHNGTPDWQFMENYIKNLPYADNI